MRPHRRCLPALALAFMLAVPAIPAASPPEPAGDPSRPSILLKFRAGEYDPLIQPPPIPDNLKLGGSQGVFIVQFDGPILHEWAQWLGERGDILAYIPDYAFVVRASDISAASFKAHPDVRFVGLFEPGFKLDPALRLDKMERLLDIIPFSGADLPALLRHLVALGANIIQQDQFLVVARAAGRTAVAIAFDPDVQWIEEAGQDSLDNHKASIICAVRSPKDGAYDWNTTLGLWSYNATTGKVEGHAGRNVTVAVCDTGVDGTHPAFEGRMTGYINYSGGLNWTDPDWHGTHVAGTVLGNGSRRAGDPGTAGYYAGMAPLANLVGQNRFSGGGNYTAFAQGAAILGADIQSNSWGSSSTADGGKYETRAVAYDRLVRDADPEEAGNRSLVEVFSAGNDGPGASSVAPPTTAKNVISVGATDNVNGTTVAGFSSRGPCLDGRIKPDIVAPGVSVTSARANSAYSYWTASGTSMACPTVAGAAAVAFGLYNESFGAPPSPAMVKALLLNGADPIPGYSWPGPEQGWGRLNLSRSLLNSTDRTIWSEDQSGNLTTGEWRNYTFRVANSTELKITLAWTDVPGALNADPALVNDLDLVVVPPSNTSFHGNRFTDGFSNTSAENDTLNNVEMVRLAAPETGWWTVSVRGANVPMGAQNFALAVSGQFGFVFPEAVDLRAAKLEILPADPEEGDAFLVRGNLTNDGPVRLPPFDCRLRISSDGQPVCETVVSAPRLAPGENWTLELGWMAARGLYNATLEVDPFSDIPEHFEDNNRISVPFKVRGYGLAFTGDTGQARIEPGAGAMFNFTVENTGNTEDEVLYAIEREPATGWNLSGLTYQVFVPSGGYGDCHILLRAPAGAKAFECASFSMRVTSVGNSSYTSTVESGAMVDQIFKMELGYSGDPGPVLPGETESFRINVQNTGNGPDVFSLSLEPSFPYWPTHLDRTRARLESGESSNFTLNMTAPIHALADSQCVVNVTVTNGNGLLRQTEPFMTTVRRVLDFELRPVSSPGSIQPGGTGRFQFRATNTGNLDQTLHFLETLPPGWSGKPDPHHADLRPREVVLVTLDISVPADSAPGLLGLSVKATSVSNPLVNRTVNLTCAVGQLFGLALQPARAQDTVEPGNGTSFVFSVRNTGTWNDTYTVEISSVLRAGWLAELNRTTGALGPGSIALFTLRISTPPEETNGTNVMRVRAQSGGDPSRSEEISFWVETARPPDPEPPAPPPPPPPPPVIVENGTILVERPRSLLVPAVIIGAVILAAAVAAFVYWRARRK